jgi:hypothetical protein
MLIVRDLIEHKNYGNAMLVNAITAHEQASADKELRNLLHHIILANQFWLSLFLDESFDVNGDSHPPRSLEDVAALYRQTHDRELEWMSRINDSDFERTPVTPFIPTERSRWWRRPCRSACTAMAIGRNVPRGCERWVASHLHGLSLSR